MLSRLKSVYPLNEIARIIDLTFSRFDDLNRRLDVLDHSIREAAESGSELKECWQRSQASIWQELEALSEKHNDIAQNDVTLMETVTCVVEVLRQVQASQTQLQQAQVQNSTNGGDVTRSLEVLNGHLRDVLVRARQREAELFDRVQDFQARLTGLKEGSSNEHLRVAQVLGDLGERDSRIHTTLASLCNRSDELHTAVEMLCMSLQDSVEKAAALADQRVQSNRAAVEELRSYFRDAMEKAAVVAGEQQEQSNRAAVEELRSYFRDAMEKAAVVAGEQQEQSNRAAVKELRSYFQNGVEKATGLVADRQAELSLERLRGAVVPRIDELQQVILAKLDKSQIYLDSAQFDVLNPDVRLLEHLYSYVPCAVAVDIGANVGDVSERLLRAGYRVYAYEPFPPVFEQLKERLGNRRDFHPHQLAVGFVDRTMDLHIATDKSPEGKYKETTTLFNSLVRHSMLDDLQFSHKIKVEVRSIESLQKSGELPSEIGVMKIDTEGYDLEVIRGMGAYRPLVLMAEFWDPRMAFGRSGAINLLEELVSEMREREYRWYVVIYRLDGHPISYYSNQPLSPPNSWGNVLFFRERAIFMESLEWCSAVLPPTYF